MVSLVAENIELLKELDIILDELTQSSVDVSSKIAGTFRALGAVGALWMLFREYKSGMDDYSAEKLFAFFKWFALVLVLLAYNPMTNFIHRSTNYLAYELLSGAQYDPEEMAKTSLEEIDAIFRDRKSENQSNQEVFLEEIQEIARKEGVFGTDEIVQRGGELIKRNLIGEILGFESIFAKLQYKLLHGVINFFLTFGIVVLKFFAKGLLYVLIALGPLSIFLSFFPGFESSFLFWLKRLINVSMWIPIGTLFQFFINKIYNALAIKAIEGTANFTVGNSMEDNVLAYLTVGGILSILALVNMIMTPMISNWLVQAAASSVASKGKRKMMDTAKKTSTVIRKTITKGA